jgi:hypothetical protein
MALTRGSTIGLVTGLFVIVCEVDGQSGKKLLNNMVSKVITNKLSNFLFFADDDN